MAIQLPRIKPNSVTGATPLPEAQAIGSQGMAAIAQGNVKLFEAAGKGVTDSFEAYEKAEDDAAKSKAKELAVKYNTAVDQLTSEFAALPLGADLSKNYLDLKKQQDDNRKRALELATNPKTKAYLRTELDSQDAVLNRPIEMKYAQSNVAKDLKNANDKNEISKRNFMTQSAFFNPKDPTSYKPLDDALKEIDSNAKDTAQALGLVAKDSAGQPIYSDNVEKEVKSSKSEAISSAVNSLITIGDPAKAKLLLDRYSDNLDSKQLADVFSKVNVAIKNRRNSEAAEEISKIADKTKQNEEIEKYAALTKDPESANKVANLVASKNRKKEAAANQLQDNMFNELADEMILNQENPSTRFYSKDEISTNPKIFEKYNMLSPANRKKFEALIERPTESDPQILEKFKLQSKSVDGWRGVPSGTFIKEAARLSPIDFSIYQSEYKEDNRSDKKGLTSQVRNQFISEVQKALEAADILPKKTEPEFIRVWNDKYAQFVLDEIAKLPANTIKSSTEYNQAVKRVVDDVMKDDYDNANVFRRAVKYKFSRPQGGSSTIKSSAPTGTKTTKELIDDL